MRKNSFLHRQAKRFSRVTHRRHKEMRFGSYKIITAQEDGRYSYEIEIQDPIYGKFHGWTDSRGKLYATRPQAVKAAKNYIDNYEPDDQPSRESDERMSFREQMDAYRRLK